MAGCRSRVPAQAIAGTVPGQRGAAVRRVTHVSVGRHLGNVIAVGPELLLLLRLRLLPATLLF